MNVNEVYERAIKRIKEDLADELKDSFDRREYIKLLHQFVNVLAVNWKVE